MPYLTEQEKPCIDWFRQLQAEAAPRCESVRLDPLGSLILALKPEPPSEAKAWLAYIAAQASGKGAAVNFHAHGVLVLVLPRYARAEQAPLSL